MTSKTEALDQIVEIAHAHQITAGEIANRLTPPSGPERTETARRPSQSSLLTRMFAYLGGIFVLAGLGIFVEMQWDELNSIARIAVTLGSGLAALAAAVAVVKDERMRAAATPLFLLAAWMQAIGILVAIDELAPRGDDRGAHLAASGILLIQQLWLFVWSRRTVLAFTSVWLGQWLWHTTLDIVGLDFDLIAFTLGLSTLFVIRSIDRGPHRAIAGFWYFLGATEMLGGLFALLQGSLFEVLFLGASCGVVFASTWVRSRSLLVVGTIAILCYVGYFTGQHFSEVVGWPIALILFGVLMIGLSASAYRIDRRYIAGGE